MWFDHTLRKAVDISAVLYFLVKNINIARFYTRNCLDVVYLALRRLFQCLDKGKFKNILVFVDSWLNIAWSKQ